MLVDDFVDAFNEHRRCYFFVSDRLCVDESFSRWYGQGGAWINMGLPCFIAFDRKPDDGCEIWSCCCGQTGVMVQLKLVKTQTQQQEDKETEDDGTNHGTEVLLALIKPWFGSDRLVCADSYFSSVQTAIKCKEKKMRYIGVVKTATKNYPMSHLSTIELEVKGERAGVIAKNETTDNPEYLAFVWRDRDRRYFIASGSSMADGTPVSRKRWRQIEKDRVTPPEKVTITIPQPQAAEVYYKVCGKIDNHNRDRQATLGLERKLKTHDWSKRVNLTILSMCMVDAWKVWSLMTVNELNNPIETQKEFYAHLAAELIDNNYDGINRRNQSGESTSEAATIIRDANTGEIRRGVGIHLAKAKRRRITNGICTKHVYQGRCNECKRMKTSFICSACEDDPDKTKDVFICQPEGGMTCWEDHIAKYHT